MRVKLKEKERAILLRKKGETIPCIAEQVGVSKASVSLWLRGISIPLKAKTRMQRRAQKNRELAQEKRKQITKDKITTAAKEADEVVQSYTVDDKTALICSALMYWCEGSKSKNDSEFTFTNSDPLAIQGFLSLLRQSLPLNENRFRIRMHLHDYHDEITQRKFWSYITKIPEKQFQRTFWKSRLGKSKKPGYQGCIHIRYYDVLVARKISAVARAFLSRVV